MTKWKSLVSEADYKAAVHRLDELIDLKRTDAVHNELNLLSFLIEDYEEQFHSIRDASPQDVIRFAMEMKGIKQQDLIPLLGTKGNVSKILSGKANLQLEDIHPLSVMLGIPEDSLIPKMIYPEPGQDTTGHLSSPARKSLRPLHLVREPRGKMYRNISGKRAAAKKTPDKKKA